MGILYLYERRAIYENWNNISGMGTRVQKKRNNSVYIEKQVLISKIDEKQQKLLDRLKLHLEYN